MIRYKGPIKLKLDVNDKLYEILVEPHYNLLYVLREQLGLTGTRIGCENGDCGACTVIIDDQPHKACMMLAVEVEGKKIITIEGLENTKVQQAFLDYNGFQCGYCTSGFIMNAYSLLKNKPKASSDEIDDWLKSNLCRCTGYEGIKNAVEAAK